MYMPHTNDEYAPVSQTLEHSDPYKARVEGDILDDPYKVPEDYYANLVMKEYQACPSGVCLEYFSVTNIKRLQRGIRREIYNRSYGKFNLSEDQSVLDLIQAMRIVYDEYAKDLPVKIIRQVKILNKQTVQYIAPDMMTNLRQHYSYLDDIKNPLNPMPSPINVNNAGRRILPSPATAYGI